MSRGWPHSPASSGENLSWWIRGISSCGTPGAAFAMYWTAGTRSAALQPAVPHPERALSNHGHGRCCLARSESWMSKVKIKRSLFWKTFLWVLQNPVREKYLQLSRYLLEQHPRFHIPTAALKTPAKSSCSTPLRISLEVCMSLLHVCSVADPLKHSGGTQAVKKE